MSTIRERIEAAKRNERKKQDSIHDRISAAKNNSTTSKTLPDRVEAPSGPTRVAGANTAVDIGLKTPAGIAQWSANRGMAAAAENLKAKGGEFADRERLLGQKEKGLQEIVEKHGGQKTEDGILFPTQDGVDVYRTAEEEYRKAYGDYQQSAEAYKSAGDFYTVAGYAADDARVARTLEKIEGVSGDSGAELRRLKAADAQLSTDVYMNNMPVESLISEEKPVEGFTSWGELRKRIKELEYTQGQAAKKYYETSGADAVYRITRGGQNKDLEQAAQLLVQAEDLMDRNRYGGWNPETSGELKKMYDQVAALKQKLLTAGYSEKEVDSALEYTVYAYRNEEAAARAEAIKKAAEEHPGRESLKAIAAAPLAGFDLLNMRSATAGRNNVKDLKNYKPASTADMPVTQYVNTVTGTVADNIRGEDPNLLRRAGAFLYQTGMSMGQSLTQVAALGPASIALMGASAASSTAYDVIERGGTNNQAYWSGLAAGAAEIIFEKFSVDNLLEGIGDSSFWRSVLKQAGVEASEEMATEIANILSDAAIMGHSSNFSTAVRDYVTAGLSEEEAKKKAFLDCVADVGLAGLGGAISGGGSMMLRGGGQIAAEQAMKGTQKANDKAVGKAAGKVFQTVEQQRQEAMKKAAPEEAAEGSEMLRIAVNEAKTKGTVTDGVADRVMADPQAMAELGSAADREAVKAALAERAGIDLKKAELTDLDRLAEEMNAIEREQAQKASAAAQLEQVSKEGAEVGKDTAAKKDAPAASEGQRTAGRVVDDRTDAGAVPLNKVLTNREVLYLNAVSRATGLNIHVVDASDNADGWYENGEIYIAANAEDPISWISTHEVTHHLERAAPEAYAGYLERVKTILSQEGDLQKMIAARQAYYAERGTTLTEEGAMRELAADFTQRLMLDEGMFRRLAVENYSLARRLLDSLKEFIRRIRAAWSGQEIRQLEATRKAWEKALRESRGKTVESGERQHMYNGGAAYAASNPFTNIRTEFAGAKTLEGESRVEPTETETMSAVDNNEVLYSLKFNTAFMDAADRMNRRNGLVAAAVMRKAAEVRQAVADIFNDPDIADSLGLPPDIIGRTYIPNGSYSGTEENTTECIRTLAADDLMDAVAEYLGRPLTVEDTIAISQEYWKYTDKPECLYCYVAMDRKAHREFLGSYLQQRDDVVKNIKSGTSKEEAYQKFLDGRKDTAPMKKRFDMWVSNIGKETISSADLASRAAMEKAAEKNASFKAQVNDALKYAQSASWAKKRIAYAAYDNHILKWKQSRIDNLNSNYGLRMYSFSDFSPAFILENMQMITDAAVRGLKVLAYTKELDFVRIFAKTGMNINISVFGYDAANGVGMDAMQGANWAEAYKLRKKHPNVGITFVATNDDQIEWALDQDWIDVIIPFHMVRTGTKVASAFGWKNYTAMSADTKGENWTKENAKHILPPTHQNDKATYLKACKDNNLTPRFADWVYHTNYMKLVNETRQSEGDTNPVQPLFDLDAAKASIETMRKQGGYYTPIGGSRENMLDIAEEIGKKINGKIPNRQNSIRGAREHDQAALDVQKQGKRLEERGAAFRRANVTGGGKPSVGELETTAKGLLKDYSSGFGSEELTDRLGRLYDRLVGGDLSGKALAVEAEELARQVLAEVPVMGETGAAIRDRLKNTRIQVPRELWADLEDEGGYNAFRQKYMGKLRLSAESGTSIDEVYEDLSMEFPAVFDMDAVEDPVNRLLQIAEVADSLRFVSENLNASDRVVVELLSGEIVERLYDMAQKGQPMAEFRAQDRKAAHERVRESVAKRERQSAQRVKDVQKKNKEANIRMRERMTATKMRDSIRKHAAALSRKLLQPSDKMHIPEHLRTSVMALLDVIDLESKYGYTFTKDAEFKRVNRLDENGKQIEENLMPTSRTVAALLLKDAYAELRSEELSSFVDPDLAAMLKEIADMGDIRVADMNTEQLRTVWNAVRAVEASVSKSDGMLGASRYGKVSSAAEALRAETGDRKDRTNWVGVLGRIDRLINLDMLTPETFLHRMGAVGEDLRRQMAAAQEKNIEILKEGVELYKKAAAKDKVDLLKLEKEMHHFKFAGGEIDLSTAQIMELYALSRRKQATEHIYKGGLRVKGGRKGLKETGESRAVKVSFADVADIVGKLTTEQKKLVDTLQQYMSTKLADHGNEASMEAYGYEKFKEKFYWPIKVGPTEVDTDPVQKAKTKTIPGFGMTKALKPHANNSVELRSALESFGEHLNQMATYAAWLTTSENITRLINFHYLEAVNGRLESTGTVKDLLLKIYGKGGEQYLTKLLSDIAEGTKTGTGEGAMTDTLFGRWKAARVGANVRVILQQPSAIVRAIGMIDAKYIVHRGEPFKAFERAKEWSAIAQWKDWGYFEVDAGRSLKELMAGTDSKMDRVKNLAMAPAGIADSFAWGILWSGIEAETRDTRKDLKEGSDEFYKAVAKRFDEIIDRTQVVDSVLHRTQIMRSANALNRLATSFMSEPSKVYNMMARAIYDLKNSEKGSDARKQAGKHLARTGVALVASFMVNAIAQSLVDAIRDDDREKGYWEKFVEKYFGITGDEKNFGEKWMNFWGANFQQNFVPFGYLPYVKDIQSVIQGFSVERSDMEGIADMINAAKALNKAVKGEGGKTVFNTGLNAALKSLDMIGLPAGNLKRDLLGIYSAVLQWTGAHWATYKMDKVMLRIGDSGNQSVFYDTLYRAMIDDYDAYVRIYEDMIKEGFEEDKIMKQIESRMAEELELSSRTMLPIDWYAPGKNKKFDDMLKRQTENKKSWAATIDPELIEIAQEMEDLIPEEGKSSVSNAQRIRAIADSNRGEFAKEDSMKRVMSEAEYARYTKARAAGIKTKDYVDLMEKISAATVARKGEKGSASQDDVEKVLNKSALTVAQKRAIWYGYGWKSESPWG